MKDIATLLRSMQLFAHAAHNIVSGAVFMQDHNMLGDLYPAYESEYDDVVERIIGLSSLSMEEIMMIQESAVMRMKSVAMSQKENKGYLLVLLDMEKALCSMIQQPVQGRTEGTKQLLGDIADKSEQRQYKLKQRCK